MVGKPYSFLEIDLNIIKHNYLYLRDLVGVSQVAATVKADAYGLGSIEISCALYKVGCRSFFVYSIEEGMELRKHLSLDAKIFVFQGVLPGVEDMLFTYKLTPVLNDLYQINLWYNYSRNVNKNLDYILHIDTGLNRFGLVEEDLLNFLNNFSDIEKNLKLNYIMSHLGCSSNPNSDYNSYQLKKFNRLLSHFPEKNASLASSSGIFLGKEYLFQLVRPGAAIYGINPMPGKKNSMLNPIRWVSKILQVKTLHKNSYIGYDKTYFAKTGSKIATINLGYADGFPLSMSNKGSVLIGKFLAKIVGRISMDLITIDVSFIPDQYLKLGQEVEIINDNITLDDFAKEAEMSSYEMLTSFSKRCAKAYVNA